MEKDKLITIGTYGTISEAYIFKNILELEGIESFVADANLMLEPPIVSTTEGMVRLAVKDSDAARAISALNRQKESQEH